MTCFRFLVLLLAARWAWAAAPPPPAADPLRAFLGADYEGARIVGLGGQQGKEVLVFDIKTRSMKSIASFGKDGRPQLRLSRPWWSPDGKQVIFSYDAKCYVVSIDGTKREQVLQDDQVVEASFWLDPKTGERCVVYCRLLPGKKGDAPQETWLFRPRDGSKTKLADRAFEGGLSRDGTHLGHAGGGVWIMDLASGVTRHINMFRSACNGTISPDNTYRIMHLYAPHLQFGVRDEWDHELWVVGGAGSANYEMPRWSNHPNFCTVFHRGLRVIKLDTQEDAPVPFGAHSVAHLWLPSGAKPAPGPPGPIGHLELARLWAYKKKLARTEDYSPVIAELSQNTDPEAKVIVDDLGAMAAVKLALAAAEENALKAGPDFTEIAARFSALPDGKQAQDILKSESFKKEYEAATSLYGLERHAWELQPVKEARSVFGDDAFLERNRGHLTQMIELIARMRARYAGAHAMVRAEEIAKQYGLPERTAEPGNKQVTVVAIIAKLSHVPTLQEIAPYDKAVFFALCHIQDVVSGDYKQGRILVVHWVINDKTPTEAATWKAGLKQILTLDRYDAHPEIEQLSIIDDINDLSLVPYLAIKAVSW